MKRFARCGIALLALISGALACITPSVPPQESMEATGTLMALVAQVTKEVAMANDFNAHATAQILVAEGENSYLLAQSTAVVADSNQGPVNTYLQGKKEGVEEGKKTGGFLEGVVGTIALFVVGFVILGLIRR